MYRYSLYCRHCQSEDHNTGECPELSGSYAKVADLPDPFAKLANPVTYEVNRIAELEAELANTKAELATVKAKAQEDVAFFKEREEKYGKGLDKIADSVAENFIKTRALIHRLGKAEEDVRRMDWFEQNRSALPSWLSKNLTVREHVDAIIKREKEKTEKRKKVGCSECGCTLKNCSFCASGLCARLG